MCLFYYDDSLREAEEKLDLVTAINILRKKVECKMNAKNLSTLLINAWFYYMEGDVNSSPATYDANLFMSIWKTSIDKGVKEFFDNDCFCFVAGYTLKLDGFYFDLQYEAMGYQLMEKCRLLTINDKLLGLANHSLGNKKFHYESKEYYKSLFANNSIIDRYFCEMIDKWQIE